MNPHPIISFDNWMDPRRAADLHSLALIGAAEEVHRLLGPGYGQEVYEEALCDEMRLRGMPFVRHPVLAIHYKGREVGQQTLDLMIGREVLVDLMAAPEIPRSQTRRMESYLRATNLVLGVLINFNVPEMLYGIKQVRAA